MRPEDIAGAYAVGRDALYSPPSGETEDELRDRQHARIGHLLDTDPGGAWVAEEQGRVVGVALALLRDRLWGVSLCAVASDVQGRGVGRRLLDAALAYGRDRARGWVIL